MSEERNGSDPEEVVNVNGGTVVDEFVRFHEQRLHMDRVSVEYEYQILYCVVVFVDKRDRSVG